MALCEVLSGGNGCQIDGWSRENGIIGNAVVRGIGIINFMTEKVVKRFNGAAAFVAIVGRRSQRPAGEFS